MPPLLGKEIRPIGHQEAEVAYVRLVGPRIIDLGDDPLGDGEPDAGALAKGSADGSFSADGPTGRDSRITGWYSLTVGHLRHFYMVLWMASRNIASRLPAITWAAWIDRS